MKLFQIFRLLLSISMLFVAVWLLFNTFRVISKVAPYLRDSGSLCWDSKKSSLPSTILICSSIVARSLFDTWYGADAYPSAPNRQESWDWLLNLFKSIPEWSNSTDPLQFLEAKTNSSSPERTPTIAFVQFQNITETEVEKLVRKRLTTRIKSSVTIPRYECTHGLCTAPKEYNRTILRTTLPSATEADILIINFLHADIPEVDRLISVSKAFIGAITVFSTESGAQSRDTDYPLALYDLFHKLYFRHDWIPIIANTSDCQTKRFECQAWILWSRWNRTASLSYVPPAGNGSVAHEIERLRSFLTRPVRNVCHLKQGFGGHFQQYGYVDGIYFLCLDQLQEDIQRGDCLVYSFGISNDWSFDDTMQGIGCEVHSFDFSIELQAHKRNTNHWYYPWGIGETRKVGNSTIMSLTEIMVALNHTSRRVSALKIDTEGAEWEMLRSFSMMQSLRNVSQLLLEFHPTVGAVDEAKLLHSLEKNGFVMFFSRQNPGFQDARVAANPPTRNDLFYELSFLNMARA